MKRTKRTIAKILTVIGLSLVTSVGQCASLSIDEAVDLALNENTSLQITKQGERTARARLKQARGQKSPSFSAGGSVSESHVHRGDRRDNSSVDASVSMPLYSGGRNTANLKRAELDFDASKLRTERAKEDLRLEVIQAYFDVLEAQKTTEIDAESVKRYEAHLENVQQLFTAGSKARLDVLRTSVELTNARQTLIRSQNDHEVKLVALKNLLHLPQDEELILTEDFSFVPFESSMEDCLAYAFANRKDLQVDEYELKRSELAVTMARAGYLPSVNLSAGVGSSHKFNSPKDSSESYDATLSASWNFWDNGVTKGAVDEAKANRDIAELTVTRDRETIDLTVRQAYYNMREAEKRFEATRAAVQEAEESYFITSEKYRVGQGILIDVLDAQVALSTAKLNYTSAQYDYARYKATVENAIGLSIGQTPEILLIGNGAE